LERSRYVEGEACVGYILAFQALTDINLFNTGFEVRELAKILTHSPHLRHLQRGDFLAEVVEHIAQTSPESVLKIEEFWASEEYFFHTREQMLSVAKFCPRISKAMFMFDRDSADDLSILCEFPLLRDLDLWGGRFYSDGLCEYIQSHGNQLLYLSFVHVEELDRKALATITLCCPQLKKLNLCNCEFEDNLSNGEGQSGAEFRDADRLRRREREQEIESLTRPMLDLEMVKVITECNSEMLEFVLANCLNVKHISLGMNTGITDQTISNVLSRNSLAKLETFSVQKAGPCFTMASVEALIANCPQLRKVKDLSYCAGIHENEAKILQCRIREDNMDLLLGDVDERRFIDPSDSAFVRGIMQEKCPPVPELFMS